MCIEEKPVSNLNTKASRIYTLDFVRIICALVVFLYHINLHFKYEFKFINAFISQGSLVMTCFFMLSGFVLQYTYFTPPPPPYPSQRDEFSALKKYFIKRFTSIYPLYLTIYLSSCILFNNLALADTLVIVPIQLTLTQSNFYMLNVVGNDATWFFSCLAISYFFFPFISHISKHISRKTQIIVLAVIYILLTISPYVMIRFMLVGIYTNPFFRGLEFVFGILLANLFIQANQNVKKVLISPILKVIFCIIALIISVTLLNNIPYYFNNNVMMYSIVGIPMFACIIFNLAKCQTKIVIKLGKSKLIQILGELSLSFFLAQIFTLSIVRYVHDTYMHSANYTQFEVVLALIVNIVIAIMMHYLIEKPLKKLFTKISNKIV